MHNPRFSIFFNTVKTPFFANFHANALRHLAGSMRKSYLILGTPHEFFNLQPANMKCGYIFLFSLTCMAQSQRANSQQGSHLHFPFETPRGYVLLEHSHDEFEATLGEHGYISDADYRYLFDYLKENNIYINIDGLRIMYELNRDNMNSQGWQSTERKAPSHPNYPPADGQLQAEANTEYSRSSLPDNSSTAKFYSFKKTFDSLYNILREKPQLSQGWRDTLAFFQNSVLRIVVRHANSICESLMDYYDLTLSSLNRLLDSLLRNSIENSGSKHTNHLLKDQYAIRSLIEDFQIPEEMLPPQFSAWSSPQQDSKIWFASYRPASSRTINSPANANIYIFKLDRNGNQKHNPEMHRYEIYYGPNGMTYSLTPHCDTLSYFVLHPTNRASNLPVVLGKGNYCFILKEVSTGKLIMQKDVNLANEAAYDDQHPVRLCFLDN
jgi:hypothetical protein